MLRIGLTGGIASGKSTIAQLFCAQGLALIDADAIARELTLAGGAALGALHQHFGNSLVHPQNGIRRDAMRDFVFQHPPARGELEQILHPFIHQEIQGQIHHHQHRIPPPPAIVMDIPLLVEKLAFWREHMDTIIAIDCPPEVQIARIQSRASSLHWSAVQIEGVLAAQCSNQERLAHAQHHIHNGANTTTAELAQQVLAICQQLLAPHSK